MKKAWWKESVVYQIYPRSFCDSNGDGIGDIRGIISKLDYLKKLGIDVIWLSPVYESPNDDNGYDISDYQAIMKEFGTMEDFDEMLAGAHERGIKIVMDLVVNHSSDEHSWFLESKKSKDNPYRDYYIWREGQNGGCPNNWESIFSGPAWEYDETTDMYYMHLFSKKQPDLNWENEKLRQEVYKMMTWWCEKGIDGFRMDVISYISKKPGLPDQKTPSDQTPYCNGPRVHEFLKEMNREVLSKYDLMTVGETAGVTIEEAKKYAGEDENELNMVFQFELHSVGSDGPFGKWYDDRTPLSDIKRIFSKWQTQLEGKAWNSLYWDNHDQPRVVSRYGDDKNYRVESAKMLATSLHTMQGTPYIYQGEELGMTNAYFENIEDYKDIEIHNSYDELVKTGKLSHERFMDFVKFRGRDNARTPMQWDSSENGGFTSGTPWIKVNPNYKEINAAAQVDDEASVFNYYKKLIQLRKDHEIIVYGHYELLIPEDDKVFMFTRELGKEKLLTICNYSADEPEVEIPELFRDCDTLLIGNYVKEGAPGAVLKLKPYEARVYLVKQ